MEFGQSTQGTFWEKPPDWPVPVAYGHLWHLFTKTRTHSLTAPDHLSIVELLMDLSIVQTFVDWVTLPFSIIWNGLPMHVLGVQQQTNFYIFFTVSWFVLGVITYFFICGNLVEKLASRFSQYLFEKSKPVLASIFTKISGNILRRLLVPLTIVTSTVSTLLLWLWL